MEPLRERLPEDTRVEIVSSEHDWLEEGMRGTIHWPQDAELPTFQCGSIKASEYWSVVLLPGRDVIKILPEKGGSRHPDASGEVGLTRPG